MHKQPNRELMLDLRRLVHGHDITVCFDLYSRFHCGDMGTEVLAEDFIIFDSIAEDIIALAKFLEQHPECIKSDIFEHYSKLACERKQDSK